MHGYSILVNVPIPISYPIPVSVQGATPLAKWRLQLSPKGVSSGSTTELPPYGENNYKRLEYRWLDDCFALHIHAGNNFSFFFKKFFH